MEVIKYRIFKTSTEFEVWQAVEKRKIKDVLPVQRTEVDIICDANYGVFVTYWENRK